MTKLWKPFLLLAAAGIMVFGLLSSGAWFTDGATSGPTVISAGTLSIDDAKLSTIVLPPITNMAPGDETGTVKIVIENNGTIPLAWFGDLMFDNNPLKNVIYIKDAEMKFLSPANTNWEPADHFITNGLGSGNWPTAWGGPGGLATLAAFDGNGGMAPGTPYEFMGALQPGYRYELTLKFGFYELAGNEYQGMGPMNITFHVDAGQINAAALDALVGATGHNHVLWLNQQIAKQP